MQEKLWFPLIYALCAAILFLFGAQESAQTPPPPLPTDTTQAVQTSPLLPAETEKETEQGTGEGETDSPESSAPPQDETLPPPVSGEEEKTISVFLADTGTHIRMAEEVYLTRVVMAEVPYSFHPEALKAQAIAARTYLYYRMAHSAVHGTGESAICTDYACCMAYLCEEEAGKRWGEEKAAEIYEKVHAAVAATEGQVVTHDGALICALFHSSSAGRTEDAENVWGTPYPYLVSVPSPEAVESSEKRVSAEELTEAMKRAGEKDFDSMLWGDPIPGLMRGSGGRVERVRYGGYQCKGTALRSALGLKSTDFTVTREANGDFLFSVRGYGHGVGLSQEGAGVLATEGKAAEEILLHYYTGCAVVEMPFTAP